MSGRIGLCLAIAGVLGTLAFRRLPFPDDNSLLALVSLERPVIFAGLKGAYLAMLFTTPYIAASVVTSLGFIFIARASKTAASPRLPAYPDPRAREQLSLVIGELHHSKKPEPVALTSLARDP